MPSADAITGLPDIETNKTSSRNPLVVDQHTIVNAFTDYEKFYLGGMNSVRGFEFQDIHIKGINSEGEETEE